MHRLTSVSVSLLAFQLAFRLAMAAPEYFPNSERGPEPRQAGWDGNCQQWTMVAQGDTCWQLAADLNMDLQDFLDINPQLHGDCVHNLWAGYWYCTATTAPPGVGPSPTVAATSPPQGANPGFTTKSTDAASFSVISPLTTGPAVPYFPWSEGPGFTTKSTDAASFSPIEKRDAKGPDAGATQIS